MTATKRRAKVRGRRSGAAHCKRGQARTCVIANPSSPSPAGDGPARRARVTGAKRFAVRCQRLSPQQIPPRKTHSDECWPIPAGMGRKISHPRKKDSQKPHPFSVLRAAAPRNQRCDETRRPTQRSRPPHRRKKQNTRIWKFFLAVPSRDGPTRRAHHCAATRSDSPKSGGQRSAAARCKISKVCNQRFANPSLPSPPGTAQRVARASQAPNDSPHVAHVDGPPASRTKEKARFYPHGAQNRAFAY